MFCPPSIPRPWLEVQEVTPKPRSLTLSRVNNSGTATLPNQLYDILKTAQLEHIQELVLKEGTTRLMSDLRPRWTGLKRLDLSNSGLVTVPEARIGRSFVQSHSFLFARRKEEEATGLTDVSTRDVYGQTLVVRGFETRE